MKYRLKKILSILLPAIVVIAAGVAWFVNRTPVSPFDGVVERATSSELVQRGEYIARLGDCVACHSTPGNPPFSGGLEMATPVGSIFTTNITPDPQAGIGNYSLADFDRAVRAGVARNGHRLYPAMPYPSYSKFTDEDVQALYAFFRQGVQPSSRKNTESEIPWPLNMRWPLALWSTAFTEPGVYQSKPSGDSAWNRGAYLVQGPGHCGSCHTPRGLAFEEKALDENSGRFLSGALLDGWYAPSLRNDPNTGLGRWSEEDVFAYLKTGRNRHGVVFGTMMEAFNNSTQFMTDDDLRGIARYLKSLPGDPARDGIPWQYDGTTTQILSASAAPSVPGAATYLARCATCHGRDGLGRGEWIPPLAGASSLLSPENASAINITLNGGGRAVAAGVPDAYRMPALRSQLSDREIAEVLSYVRSAWGNKADAVKPDDVRKLREHTNPASAEPIILQMR